MECLGEVKEKLLAEYQPRDGWQAPDMNAVEALWTRFERLTRKYWWLSLTWSEYYAGQRIPFPGWGALGE